MKAGRYRAYEAAYAVLNKEQKRAVDTIEGPVMVIAGPGTGKTQILTLRIAAILLHTDTRPEHILALTFTQSGVAAMRERLVRYIGTDGHRVTIATFHGFAERLVAAFPHYFERIAGGTSLNTVERIGFVEEVLLSGDYHAVRPRGAPAFHVPALLGALSFLKREHLTPDAFAAYIAREEEALHSVPRVHERGAHKGKVRREYLLKEAQCTRNRELLDIYRRYEALLRKRRRYDFDDMLVEVIRAMEEHEEFRAQLWETHQYILADEHQDANGSQNKVLELLASFDRSPNLFVVGDEKQAIFRFQGASLENFLYFEDKFEGTTTISLIDNYRSGQNILDVAHRLIAVAEGPAAALRVPLVAHAVQAGEVTRRTFSHEAVEDGFLIRSVQALLKDGVPPQEIAVIVRTNREVEELSRLLRDAGSAVVASAETDILSHPATGSVRALIAAAARPQDEAALFEVLHSACFDVPAGDLVRVCAARNYRTPLAALVRSRRLLSALGVEGVEAVLRVGAVLDRARRQATGEAPQRVLAFLLNESGLLRALLSHEAAAQNARVVRRLYDEVERLYRDRSIRTLDEVIGVFDRLVLYRQSITAPFVALTGEAVAVLTAHKSKGREFDHVFIPRLTDRTWGAPARRGFFTLPVSRHVDTALIDEDDDERRLLFVAITRARKTVSLSASTQNVEGSALVPSRFFDVCDKRQVRTVATDKDERAFHPAAVLATPPPARAVDTSLIAHLFYERGLSATSLGNYLDSPWKYLYRTLLRVPEPKSPAQLYGTALHEVLRRVGQEVRRGGTLPDAAKLKQWLRRALQALPLTSAEYTAWYRSGGEALAGYVEAHKEAFVPHVQTEYALSALLPADDASLPPVPLRGTLDRLDFDKEGRAVCVVDYKTGTPQSRRSIEGNTKASTGAYKRQLVFYALLLRLSGDARLSSCERFAVSFVEPSANGSFKDEEFVVHSSETEALKTQIQSVARAITTGAFLEEPCDPKEVPYCTLGTRFLER